MYVVYILKSIKDPSRYYIGMTEELNRRLREHNNSKSGYSKKYAPWEIETYISFRSRLLAERFEKYLKAGSGQAFLKKRLLQPSISTEPLSALVSCKAKQN